MFCHCARLRDTFWAPLSWYNVRYNAATWDSNKKRIKELQISTVFSQEDHDKQLQGSGVSQGKSLKPRRRVVLSKSLWRRRRVWKYYQKIEPPTPRSQETGEPQPLETQSGTNTRKHLQCKDSPSRWGILLTRPQWLGSPWWSTRFTWGTGLLGSLWSTWERSWHPPPHPIHFLECFSRDEWIPSGSTYFCCSAGDFRLGAGSS